MTEQHPIADEAARYVLGQLSTDEQREFETRLGQSAELRALVQELEEGVTVLARAVPQRPPPPQIWLSLEQAIAAEAQEKIVSPWFWSGAWRYAATAAAACLLGWLGHTFWHQHKEVSPDTSPMIVTVPAPAVPTADKSVVASPDVAALAAVNANHERELGGLRRLVATLRIESQQLTRIVARQQTLLIEPGRFKMLSPQTNSSNGAAAALSPELQRALFHAMARELGWVPATDVPEANQPAGATNQLRLDFVDLTPATNNPPTTAEVQMQEDDSLDPAHLASTAIGSSGNVPGFISGTNLVLAFDASVVPRGSAVSFWVNSDSHGQQWLGTTTTGDDPTVVTVPTSTTSGWSLTITANSGSGPSNVLGQFFTH